MRVIVGVETCRRRLLSVASLPGVNPEGTLEEKLVQVSSLLPLEAVNLVTDMNRLFQVSFFLSLHSSPPSLSPSSLPSSLPPPGSKCRCSIEVRGEEATRSGTRRRRYSHPSAGCEALLSVRQSTVQNHLLFRLVCSPVTIY